MCDLCIGGLHIPYSALLPILIFVFQWMSAQLSIFFGLKSHVDILPDYTKAQILLQNRKETTNCTVLWCLCRKMTRRRRNESIDSSTPHLVHEPLSRSESSDNEKSYHSEIRQTNFSSIMTSSFILPPGSVKLCMPCMTQV